MVKDYVDQIRAIQPAGPYHLLGWSFGGTAAHAIAIELQDKGAEVGLLAMLDSFPGAAVRGRRPDGDEIIADIAHGLSNDLTLFDRDQLSALVTVFQNNVQIMESAMTRVFRGDLLYFTATLNRPDSNPTPNPWCEYVEGWIDNHDVHVEHRDLMQESALSSIGPTLDGKLRDVGRPARP
jgi:thioesterase domain-containing protein